MISTGGLAMKRALIAIGSLAAFALLISLHSFGQAYGAEEQGKTTAPAAQPAGPEGMMGGPGMMGGQRMMRPYGPCPCMTGAMGPMGGPPMMFMRTGPGMGMGMMGMGMMGMYADPKTRGQMIEIRGRMLQEIGKLMEERGKEIAAGKK
jgi:hypothetical protein